MFYLLKNKPKLFKKKKKKERKLETVKIGI